MKKNKGFTLIELLAIIVILAIIAVITVPIILNIIENANKGAVTDSAYGYKDAINKYYLTKLADDPNFEITDGTYTRDQLKTMGVTISGQEPESNSWVEINHNEVINACIQFGEYKIEIINGKLGLVTKGTCINPANYTAAQLVISKAKTTTDTKNPVTINHTDGITDYRYMGADPDNYILFNCSDYSNQSSSTCETWRIIGVFGNNLKIIKETSIGNMEWNTSSNNNWANASLNTYLNGTYYNGLNNDDTRSLIENTTWNLGGWGYQANQNNPSIEGAGQFSESAYLKERGTEVDTGNLTTTTARIGLMYPSDFGFASSSCYSMCPATSDSCGMSTYQYNLFYVAATESYEYYDEQLDDYVLIPATTDESDNFYNYSSSVCETSNWMFKDIKEWTITQRTSMDNNGIISINWNSISTVDVSDTLATRPTLYLISNIKLEGTGTSSDPYKIIKNS